MFWYLVAALAALLVACSSGTSAPKEGDQPDESDISDSSDLSDALEQPDSSDQPDELLTDDAGPQAEFPDEGYPSPEPGTCDFIGANCGEVILDGGEKLSCGECLLPDTCGGGGTPHVCGHQLCDEGWCWEHPYPQGDTLNDIYALDGTHVWAVGDSTVMFYNGVSWERLPYQLRQGGNMQAIYAADADHVWAVATDGCILFLKDGLLTCDREIDEEGFPTHWTENENALYDIHGTGPDDIWAAGREIILHWDGEAWTTVSALPSKVNALWAVAPRAFWAAGEMGLLYHDDTNFSSTMTSTVFNDIVGLPSGELWAVGDGGAVARYDGDAWDTVEPPRADIDYTMVGALADGQVFVADAEGMLWRHLDEAWIAMPVALQGTIRSASRSGERLWVAGDRGFTGSWDTKFFSTNRQRLPGAVKALFANSPFDVWVAGDRFFAHWSGTAWRFMASRRDIVDLYGSAYNDIYAETADGYLHYDGTRWSTAEPDEATVTALKAARDEFFSRPDAETVRWCFEEGDCWSFTGLRFERELPADRITTLEWPFEGLASFEPGPIGPTSACALDGGFYFATDGLRSLFFNNEEWRQLDPDIPLGNATAVACTSDSLYLADRDGAVWSLVDGDLSETAVIEEGTIDILSPSVDGALYAVVDTFMGNGKLYRIDGSISERIDIPGDPPILSLAAVADDDIWAGGANALYHWDGVQWMVTLPADLTDRGLPPGETEVYLTRIFALDADNIWMLGASPDGATAYIFSYDGTKWVNDARTSLYGELAFTDVWATDQQNAYLTMNAEGWIYHYKNLGAVGMIDYVHAPAGTPFSAIAGRDGEEMRVFAPGGAIMRYDF